MRLGLTWGALVLPAVLACSTADSSIQDAPQAPVLAVAGPPCAAAKPAWIFCDDFEADRSGKYFEYITRNGSFARTAGVGANGSYGMKASFKAGQVDAGALHLAFGRTPQSYFRPADAGTANYRELWWRFRLKYQAGWIGGSGWKVSRMFSFASPTSWAQSMVGHLAGGNAILYKLLIDPVSGTDPSGNLLTTTYNDFAHFRSLGSVKSQTMIFAPANAGRWFCVEAHIKLNTATASDGAFELWIDGQPEASRTGMNWVGSFDTYGLNAVFLENYWNGGSPKEQERYFDDLIVSTQPIGCQ